MFKLLVILFIIKLYAQVNLLILSVLIGWNGFNTVKTNVSPGQVFIKNMKLLKNYCFNTYAGPNAGFECGQQYGCIKSLEYHKRQKILQTDRSFMFCFMFCLDKYAFL